MGCDLYTFSAYVPTIIPVIKRRPWWNLFGLDEVHYEKRMIRRSISITEEEKRELVGMDIFDPQPLTVWHGLFLKAFGGEIAHPELIAGEQPTQYLPAHADGCEP